MGMFSRFDRFQLRNVDTGEVHQGQFYALNLSSKGGASWAQHTALSRQHAVSQFLHGQMDIVSFDARYYQKHAEDDAPRRQAEQLRSWHRRDDKLGRPPILEFTQADGHLIVQCFMESADVRYEAPTIDGELREVSVNVTLRQYVEFDINAKRETDTRYHHARERDYYEMLAWREYRNPLLGDVVRKRNPDKLDLVAGTVVALPAVEGVRDEPVVLSSVALQTSFGRKDTPQRRLRIDAFRRRSASATSHVMR